MNLYKLITVGALTGRVKHALRDAGARWSGSDWYVMADRPPKVFGCRARKMQPRGPVIIRTEQEWDRWLSQTFGLR